MTYSLVETLRVSHDHVACVAARAEVKAEFGFDLPCQFCIDHANAYVASFEAVRSMMRLIIAL